MKLILAIIILFSLLLTACSKSGSEPLGDFGIKSPSDTPSENPTATKTPVVTIVSGNNQIGNPSAPLNDQFTVMVTLDGAPLVNVPVGFNVTSGNGGTFSSSVLFTNSSGMAQTTFTPGTGIGVYTIQAGYSTASAVFTVNVQDLGVINMSVFSGDNQISLPSVQFGSPLVLLVTRNGVPLANASVGFSIVSGAGGSFSSPVATTNGSGLAQTNFTPSATISNYVVRASYGTSTALFNLTVADAAGQGISILPLSNNQTAAVGSNLPNPLRVLVVNNSDSTPVQNATVRFDVNNGNGRINGSSNSLDVTTDGSGMAFVSFQVGTIAGVNNIRASLAASPSNFVTFTATGTVSASQFSLSQSTVEATPSALRADGVSTTTLTLIARDIFGNQLNSGGASVIFLPIGGTLIGSVTDHNNGTYTQQLRAPSSTSPGNALMVTATYNGQTLTSAPFILGLLAGNIDLAQSSVSSAGSIVANGSSTTLITVTLKDTFGNQITNGGETVVIAATGGTLLGSVVDNGNGTYSQMLRSSTVAGTYALNATLGGLPLTNSGSVAFNPGPFAPSQSLISASPSTLNPDGVSTSTILVILKDSFGNLLNSGGHTVIMNSSLGTWSSLVTDNADGSYRKTLMAPLTSGTGVVTATVNGVALSNTRTIYFSNGLSGPSVATSQVDIIGPALISANNSSTLEVKVTLKDSSSTNLGAGGSSVVISTTAGTKIGSIVDNGDGTYSQFILSTASPASNVVISATVDGNAIIDNAVANFYGPISLATSIIKATPSSIDNDGVSTTMLVLQAKDVNGISIPVGGLPDIAFSSTLGTLVGSISDNNNGTYTQQLRSTVSSGTAIVSATKSSVAFSATKNVLFQTPSNMAGLTIDCLNIATYKNKPVMVDNGTLIMNTRGPNGYCPNEFIFTTVTIRNNATLTHTAIGTGANLYGLEIQADIISISANSKIDVNGKGFQSATSMRFRVPGDAGPQNVLNKDSDNVTTADTDAGGSHAGEGASQATKKANATYGSLYNPVEPGASGGLGTIGSGAGGGQIKLIVLDTLTVDGQISANGNNGINANLGAGGSVLINAGTINGTGYISANGGAGATNANGGGGGRVAIYYLNLSGNFSYPSNVITNVRAYGGTGSATPNNGSAGTVFLKSPTQTYGDLIINNNGAVVTGIARTLLKVPNAALPDSVSTSSLVSAGWFADSISTRSPYIGYYVDPKINQNATATKSDNTAFLITSATNNTIGISSGNLASLGSTSDQFELFLIFDNMEVRGAAPIGGNAKVLVNKGDISSNNTLTANFTGLTSGNIEFYGTDLVIDSNGYSGTTSVPLLSYNLGGSLTLKNGVYSLANTTLNSTGLYLVGATLTAGTTKGTKTFNLTGPLSLTSTSSITQVATSTILGGTEYALDVNATGLTVDGTSSISATGKGYLSTVVQRCRVVGNKDVLNWASNAACTLGASHGGWGGVGSVGCWNNLPYGSFYRPFTSGASCNHNTTNGAGYGGGIIYLELGTGVTTINGVISADGTANSNGGAGGSIYISGGAFSGTGQVTANGGGFTINGWGGGSGGRIALHYVSMAGNFAMGTSLINTVRAFGGVGQALGRASPGTIFIKDKNQTLGDLIVNNNGILPMNGQSPTRIGASVGNDFAITTSSALSPQQLTAGSLQEHGEETNWASGLYLNPNIAQNGTSVVNDDNVYLVSSNLTNKFNTSSGDMTSATATAGNTFTPVLKLRNLQLSNFAILNTSFPITVSEGDVISNDTTGFVANGYTLNNTSTPALLEFNPLGTVSFTNSYQIMSGFSAGAVTFDTSSVTVTSTITASSIAMTNSSLLTCRTLRGTNCLDLTGALTLTASSRIDQAITSGVNLGAEYSIEVNAGSLDIALGCSINATGKGYTSNTADLLCRGPGNQDISTWSGVAMTATGASHGGYGLSNDPSHYTNLPYGSFANPYTSGASCRWASQVGTGGGIIRLNLGNGAAVINGTIGANGTTSGSSAAAGGSIWINAGSISGATGVMQTNGSAGGWGGSSGGRIAVYYNSMAGNFALPSTVLSGIQAYGGTGASPGTVFIKDKAQTYGDLIINAGPGGAPITRHTYKIGATVGNDLSASISSAVAATTLNSGIALTEHGKNTNWSEGLYLNPNIAQNGTASYLDDSLFKIVSQDSGIFTVASGNMTSVGSVGNTFAPTLVVRNLQISNKATLNTPFPIIVKEGDLISNDLDDINFDGYISRANNYTNWPEFQNGTDNVTLTNAPVQVLPRTITANSLSLGGNTILYCGTLKGNLCLNISGPITLTGTARIDQLSTSTAVTDPEYSLEINGGSLNLCPACVISAANRGYYSANGAKCRVAGNQDVVSWSGSTNVATGASYGGYASSAGTHYTNLPYGSFANPYHSGASCNWSGGAGRGGGIVRINLGGGSAIIDGIITTNGETNGAPGAGGSIYINGGNISGVGSIQSNGMISPNGWGSSSGGRIAIYYNSLSGNFSLPNNALANIQAYGGAGGIPGSNGTVFLKDKAQTYGDLILNNNGVAPTTQFAGRIGATIGNAFAGALNVTGVTATTLTRSNTYPEYTIETGWLQGVFVNPNVNQNGTATFNDDTMYSITSHNSSTITATGANMSSLAIPGDTFALVLAFNNLQVSGKGVLNTPFPIVVKEGDLISGGTDEFNMNGYILNSSGAYSFPDFATTINNMTIAGSATLNNLVVNTNLTVNSGSVVTANTISVGGTLNIDGAGTFVQTGTTDNSVNLAVTGTLNLTNGATLRHRPYDGVNNYRLYATANALNIDATSSVNASNIGYTSTASGFRLFNNATFLTRKGTSGLAAAGGSHGGLAGEIGSSPHYTNEPYGSFSWPLELGAGSGGWASNFSAGGGAVRLNIATTITNNGSIKADGVSAVSSNGSGGAGGSILIQTNTLQGSGSISANGGNGYDYGGGSGGRIALYYNSALGNFSSPTNVLTYVLARGGNNTTNSIAQYIGAAGTVYLKPSAQAYGSMIINNANVGSVASNRTTWIIPPTGALSSDAVTSTVLTKSTYFGHGPEANNLTAADGYRANYGLLNKWFGFYLNPNTTQNGTTKINDDTMFRISSSNSTSVTTAGDMQASPVFAANGQGAKLVLVFNNLEIKNRGFLSLGNYHDTPSSATVNSNMGLYVLEGDLSSNNTTSFVQDGGLTTDILDLTPATTRSTTANTTGTINYSCTSAACP